MAKKNIDEESGLTTEERNVADLLAMAWNEWVTKCDPQPIESHEFMSHINALMNVLSYRVAVREHGDYWEQV